MWYSTVVDFAVINYCVGAHERHGNARGDALQFALGSSVGAAVHARHGGNGERASEDDHCRPGRDSAPLQIRQLKHD